MNGLYNHGIKQLQQLTRDLSQFEKNLSTSPLSLQGAITASLTAYRKTVNEFSELVKKNQKNESNSKQELRANKFNDDLINFTKKFDALKRQRESALQEENKQQLLGRRNHSQLMRGQNDISDNPYDLPQQLQQQQQEYMSYQEGLYNERQSLGRGSQQLDHILEMGQQALEDIIDQNEVLRRVQVKFEESLVTLGVSRGTIRSVELRAKKDKWLFWGCFIITMVAFWYIYKFFK